MGYHKEQHIKQASTRDGAEANKSKAETIGGKLSLSGIPEVIAQGGIVTGSSVTLQGKITANNTAKLDSKNATSAKGTANSNTVKALNASSVVVEQNMPGDVDGWKELGYDV